MITLKKIFSYKRGNINKKHSTISEDFEYPENLFVVF